MRILAVRGRNIASLAEPFSLDFTAEPLRSAGLFAITGETGAGKSSLLDALCLALYARCPRLGADSGDESLPDVAGDMLSAGDPRSCLRRGAAEGQAEVDYLGVDGVRYTAIWTARRSRNRAAGRLQAVARELRRIDDGTVVASQTREVLDAVERTTGLTYDEFRRTVLLAQGDFDAFLRADAPARAGLLEKVTGTSVYRDISRRVFERCAAAERAVADIETRMGEHRVRPEEERAALLAERAVLEAESADDVRRRVEVDTDIARWDRLGEARARLAAAVAAAAAAAADRDALALDRERAAMLERAEPLRPLHVRAVERRAEATRAEEACAATRGRVAATAGVAERVALALAQATGAAEEHEAAFKAFGPIWTMATRRDEAVATARTEDAAAAARLEAAAAVATQAVSEEASVTARRDGALAARDKAREHRQALAGQEMLARRWHEVEPGIRKRAGFRAELAGAEEDLARSTRRAAEMASQFATIEAALQHARDQRNAATEQASSRSLALSAADPEGLARRAGLLATLSGVLRDALRVTADHQAALRDRTTALDRHAAETRALTAAREHEQQAQAGIVAARAAVEVLTGPLARAQDAASEQAARLRLRLTPGEPCPVCGARDHPVHADAALQALAEDLKERLVRAQGSLAAAQDAAAQAQARAAAAGAGAAEASRAADSAAARLAAAATAYGEALTPAGRLAAELGWEIDLPPGPEGAEAPLAACQARLVEEDTAVRQAVAAAADLRADLDRLQKARDARTHEIDQLERDRAGLAGRIAEERVLAERATSTRHNAGERLASSTRELAPLLEPAGVTPADLDRDVEAAIRVLARRVAEVEAAAQAEATADALLRELEPLVAQSAERAAAARLGETEAKRDRGDRAAALQRALAERATLLDGEPTESHRSRINAARLEARGHQEQAAADAQRAHVEAAAAVQAEASARNSLNLACLARDEAERDLAAALADAGLDADTLARRLLVPAAEAEALRRRLRSADDALLQAATARAEREADLTALEAAGIPEASREDLLAVRAGIEERQTARLARIQRIGLELDSDDAIRSRLAAFEADLAGARASAAVWKAVSAAIGSRTGDRFARFAQGVTLDMLVEIANQRLAELKPRYRLARVPGELALHVIDTDMGDEIRATRSLSGGERFLVSLSLALALSGLGGRRALAGTLFIDEGFGALDGESLDVAIDALEALQSQGRMVGVISHVDAMKERIPVQVRVARHGAGRSTVTVVAPAGWTVAGVDAVAELPC